jgi:hypothetical protein
MAFFIARYFRRRAFILYHAFDATQASEVVWHGEDQKQVHT